MRVSSTVLLLAAAIVAVVSAGVGGVGACRHPFAVAGDVPDKHHGAGTHCWLGIPYARPPTGDRRWAKPVPLSEPLTSLPASPGQYSAACMQKLKRSPPPPYYAKLSEDCLYLNVFAPTTRASKLPVLVFIHGGSYTSGTGAIPIYNGQDMITQTNATVVVTINYRLGVFGFLGSDDLMAEQGTTGNFGILDMIASLQWVKRNIHLWNGDADRITVFGESAGAFAICSLIVTPLAQGLFQRAIMESGNCRSALTRNRTEEVANVVSTTLDCQHGETPQARLACLRRQPAAGVLKATSALKGLGGTDRWAATIDQSLLSASPLDLMRKSGVRKEVTQVMFGTNLHEGRFFTVLQPAFRNIHADQFAGAVHLLLSMHLSPKQVAAVTQYYLKMLIPGAGKAAGLASIYALKLGQIITDSTFVCPALWSARAVDRHRQRTYMYRFDHTPTCTYEFVPKQLWPVVGAQHSAELPFVFDTRANRHCKKGAAGQRLAWAMVDMWVAFASNGDPNPTTPSTWGTFPADFKWSPFTADADGKTSPSSLSSSSTTMNATSHESLAVLNDPLTTTDHYRDDVCKFWADLYGDAL